MVLEHEVFCLHAQTAQLANPSLSAVKSAFGVHPTTSNRSLGALGGNSYLILRH